MIARIGLKFALWWRHIKRHVNKKYSLVKNDMSTPYCVVHTLLSQHNICVLKTIMQINHSSKCVNLECSSLYIIFSNTYAYVHATEKKLCNVFSSYGNHTNSKKSPSTLNDRKRN